jgi:hypothetical protein
VKLRIETESEKNENILLNSDNKIEIRLEKLETTFKLFINEEVCQNNMKMFYFVLNFKNFCIVMFVVLSEFKNIQSQMETKSDKNENIIRNLEKNSETRLEKLETNFNLLVKEEVNGHFFFVLQNLCVVLFSV